MWRIYKEGQGKWGRGLLAFGVLAGTLYAMVSLHEALPVYEKWTLPIVRWSFDYRFLIEAPILIGALVVGVWLYNRPRTADFLIETEHELMHKVTWPSRREEINASTVVIVAVILFTVIIFAADASLTFLQSLIFEESPPPGA